MQRVHEFVCEVSPLLLVINMTKMKILFKLDQQISRSIVVLLARPIECFNPSYLRTTTKLSLPFVSMFNNETTSFSALVHRTIVEVGGAPFTL